MKLITLLATLLAIPLCASFAHGQNLFRTGRPDYARNYASTYHDRYAEQALRYQTPRATDSPYDYSREQPRLPPSWGNDRYEALRYEAPNRFRLTTTDNYGRTLRDFDRAAPSQAAGYRDVPVRRCNCMPRDVEVYPPYDDALRSRPPQQQENRPYEQPTTYRPNLNRTASRPFTSLFDSLFGIGR